MNQNLPNCVPASNFCSNCFEDDLLRLPNRFFDADLSTLPSREVPFCHRKSLEFRQKIEKLAKQNTKKSSRVALQCSIALTNAFRTLPERSRGLLESSLKPSAVSFCTSSRGFTRTCARERTLCATSLRLSQQPARSLLESSLKPSAVSFCTSSRAFMRICARQRISCAHSLSNLLAVLIPEKFCNPSRALMRIYAR